MFSFRMRKTLYTIMLSYSFENPIVEVFDPVHDRMIQTHRLYECEGVHYILAA